MNKEEDELEEKKISIVNKWFYKNCYLKNHVKVQVIRELLAELEKP